MNLSSSFVEGTPRSQKVIALVFVLLLGNALVYFFIFANFIPEPAVLRIGGYAAVAYVCASVIIALIMKKRGLWKVHPEGARLTKTRKTLGLIASGPMAFILAWANFSFALPSYITSIGGENGTTAVEVEKKLRYGRFSFCRHQIKLEPWWKHIFFRFCVSQAQFSALPEKPFVAKFRGAKSSLGMVPSNMERAE